MLHITIDGMLSGTGIRDTVNGGYLKLDSFDLPESLIVRIEDWLSRYANAHYNQYSDSSEIELLDKEGIEIASLIKAQIMDCKVEYFSDAKMENIPLI